MEILEIEGVSFKYDAEWILRDINLKIRKGELWGILGPNGSGKTTLMNLIDGIISPQQGAIKIGGIAVGEIKRKELAKLIAVVPQETAWVFPLTVEEVVLMGRTPHLGKCEFESKEDLKAARLAMEATDILTFSSRLMQSLSGGERQRVLIARALAQQPKMLLLDEPTSSLDIAHQISIFDLLRSLSEESGLTVLAATHDMNLASLYCDRIALLHNGNFYSRGMPEEALTEESIREVYGVNVVVDRHPLTGLPRISLLGSHSSKRGSRWKAGAAPHL
jgi:iron complex transport system ATP-binding protein